MKRDFELLRKLILFYGRSEIIIYCSDIVEKYKNEIIRYNESLLFDADFIELKHLNNSFEKSTPKIENPIYLTDKGKKVYKLIEDEKIWKKAIDIFNRVNKDRTEGEGPYYSFENLLFAIEIIKEKEKKEKEEKEEDEPIKIRKNLIFRNDYTVLDFIRFFYDKPRDDLVKCYFESNYCIQIIGINTYYGKDEKIKIVIDLPCDRSFINVNNMTVKSFLDYLNELILSKNINKYIDILIMFEWHNKIKIKEYCIADKIYINFVMDNFEPLSPIENKIY